MTRKYHLQHTQHNGPTCQTGRAGAALRGEHNTTSFSEFVSVAPELQCSKCLTGKLFAFLQRKEAEAWEPEHPDAWKIADDALIAARKAK